MLLELVVSKVVEAAYVDLNDFDGFRVPGKVVLHTVDRVPVGLLPDAELAQYGHTDARGVARLRLREARRLFGEVTVGDVVTAEVTVLPPRNSGMRKMGVFYCAGLRKAQ